MLDGTLRPPLPPGAPGDFSWRRAVRTGLPLAALFAATALLVARPISDPDFFWHLATGRWIWEHRQLPDADPFNFTTGADASQSSPMARLILRQYWLANLLQYGVWRAAGPRGIICLRIVVVLLTLFLGLHRLRRRGLGVLAALVPLAALAHVLASFPGDRPNQMSFLLLAALLALIDDLVPGPRRRAAVVLLPALMLIWANVHGSFILGTACAGIYLLAELARPLLLRGGRPDGVACAALAAAMFAGLANPNGYGVALHTLAGEYSLVDQASVTELMSPFDVLHLGTRRHLVQACFLFAAAAVALAARATAVRRECCAQRRGTVARPLLAALADIAAEALLVLVFASLSLLAVRFIPLLAVVCIPIAGRLLAGRPDRALRRLSRIFLPEAALLALAAAAAWSALPFSVLRRPPVAGHFPEPAVRFIRDSRLEGRMFNFYDWGGYLLWRFYPERMVFIDGRAQSPRAHYQYLAVSGGDLSAVAGRPAYQAVLDALAVRTILIPGVQANGGLLPLIWLLERDPEWKLVFCAGNCLLYARKTVLPGLPKIVAYAVAREGALAAARGEDPRPYLAVARTDIGLGRWDEAAAFLEGALRQRPSLRGGAVEEGLALVRAGRDILREDTGLP